MAQQSFEITTTRPYGLGRNFRRTAKGLLFLGALLLSLGLFAEAATAAPNPYRPQLNSQRASFSIPANNPTNTKWTLNLWTIAASGKQSLVGTQSATSGKLVIAVPQTPNCHFQVDLYRLARYMGGFKRYLTACGQTPPTSTTSSSTSTTTTSTTSKTTPTTKAKTGGGSGSSTTVATKSGSSPTTAARTGSSATAVSSGRLAFTGAGTGMWLIATLGALFLLAGAGLLLYTRRYSRAS